MLFFVALFAAIPLIQVSPAVAIAAAVVAILSFIYTTYLWVWGIGKGDPRLLRRGESGTAEVLTAKETSWTMASGEYYEIGAPNIWKYRLEVTRSGHGPYKTKLYVCARLHEGATIPVKVSRWNHKRVAIDGPAISQREPGATGARGATRRSRKRWRRRVRVDDEEEIEHRVGGGGCLDYVIHGLVPAGLRVRAMRSSEPRCGGLKTAAPFPLISFR